MLTYDAQGDDEQRSLPHIDHGFHFKLPPGILPHGLPTMKEVASAITPLEHKKEPEEKNIVSEFFLSSLYINLTFVLSAKELSEEQIQMIILSEDFQRFVLCAGRVIERAISENVDIYTEVDNEESNDERTHARLSMNRAFYEHRWSKNRCITSMNWSTYSSTDY